MRARTDDFDALMAALVLEEGPRLLTENEHARDTVPPAADAAAKAVLASIAAGAGLAAAAKGAAKSAARHTARGVLLPAAVGLGAAAAVTAGALVGVPMLRQRPVGAGPEEAAVTLQRRSRAPAEYAIPSPGAEFEVSDGGEGGTVAYRWFSADDGRAVLAEIAYRLPDGAEPPEDAEEVWAGGLRGVCYAAGGAWYAQLRDGEVTILISVRNADRQALLDYAEKFAGENGLN